MADIASASSVCSPAQHHEEWLSNMSLINTHSHSHIHKRPQISLIDLVKTASACDCLWCSHLMKISSALIENLTPSKYCELVLWLSFLFFSPFTFLFFFYFIIYCPPMLCMCVVTLTEKYTFFLTFQALSRSSSNIRKIITLIILYKLAIRDKSFLHKG